MQQPRHQRRTVRPNRRESEVSVIVQSGGEATERASADCGPYRLHRPIGWFELIRGDRFTACPRCCIEGREIRNPGEFTVRLRWSNTGKSCRPERAVATTQASAVGTLHTRSVRIEFTQLVVALRSLQVAGGLRRSR